MKNDFEREYAAFQAISQRLDTARTNDNEAGMKAARAEIEVWRKRLEAKGDEYGRMYRLYRETQERGNAYPDFSEVIWDKDVPSLIERLGNYGFERFTFSSGWTGSVEIAWAFLQNGCTLEGLIEINGTSRDGYTDDFEKCHGYLFRVN